MELAMGRRPGDLLDPASMNPEQLTSTPTKHSTSLMRKSQNWQCLEVQQKNIRRNLAERMKFVPSDLRAREHALYWQEDPSKIQQ